MTGVKVSVALAGAEPVSVPLVGLMLNEKSGGGAVMVTVTAVEVDLAKLALPPYCAVMEWLLTARVVVEKVPTPEESRAPLPMDVTPS